MKTQAEQIKAHLTAGRKLNPLQALKLYGCFRLGARIFELKEAGMPIKRKIITRGEKHYAQYSI